MVLAWLWPFHGIHTPKRRDALPRRLMGAPVRLAALTPEDLNRFIPLCPDFALELRSDTDRISVLQAKMEEYIANGARLGLLIDPQDKRVYIYRPDRDVEILENPETASADPILPDSPSPSPKSGPLAYSNPKTND